MATASQAPLNQFPNPEDQPSQQAYALNKQWAKPGPYLTALPVDQEVKFRQWVKENNVNWHPDEMGYDMRGFWKGLMAGDPHAHTGIDAGDGKLHYSDWWKTPYDPTFSNESQHAMPHAPHWVGESLVTSDGRIVVAPPKRPEGPKTKKLKELQKQLQNSR